MQKIFKLENGSQGDYVLNDKVSVVKVKKEDIKLFFAYSKNGFLSIRSFCESADLERLFLKFILKCFGNKYKIISDDYNDKSRVVYYHTNLPIEKVEFETPSKDVEVKVRASDIELIGFQFKRNETGNLSVLCDWYTRDCEEIILNSILKCFGKEYHIIKWDWEENEGSIEDFVWYHTNLPYQKFLDRNYLGKIQKIETKQEDIITIGEPDIEKTGNVKMGCQNIMEVLLFRSMLQCFGEEYKIESIVDMYDCTTNLPYKKVEVFYPSPKRNKE